ncbi:MAG: PIN domain-containing protein [Gemmatimonas sp.]
MADTGALYALMDASDRWHQEVVAWWSRDPLGLRDIRVPITVLPELAYLLSTRINPQAEQAFIDAVVAGEFTIEPLDDDDVVRAADIMRQYHDLPLGFVDATVIAIAERLDAREILTTDRRHFHVVRPQHVRSLTLVPVAVPS